MRLTKLIIFRNVLWAADDVSLECKMYNYLYPVASPLLIKNLLNPLTQTRIKRDKLQTSLLQKPTFRIVKIHPMKREGMTSIDKNLCTTALNLTVCFIDKNNHDDHLNLPFNHPNLKPPFPAANDDERSG